MSNRRRRVHSPKKLETSRKRSECGAGNMDVPEDGPSKIFVPKVSKKKQRRSRSPKISARASQIRQVLKASVLNDDDRNLEKMEAKFHRKLEKIGKQLMDSRAEGSILRGSVAKANHESIQRRKEASKLKKEKLKLEKEIRDVHFRLDVIKKKLVKSESEKNKLSRANSNSQSDSGLFSDMCRNFKDLVESHMQCSICSEIFVVGSSITCGHTFCEECIEEWKRKKQNCPICRADIGYQVNNHVLDEHIDKMIEQFFPESAKKQRLELKTERAEKKEKRLSRSSPLRRSESSSSSNDNGFPEEHIAFISDSENNDESLEANHYRRGFGRWLVTTLSSSLQPPNSFGRRRSSIRFSDSDDVDEISQNNTFSSASTSDSSYSDTASSSSSSSSSSTSFPGHEEESSDRVSSTSSSTSDEDY